MGGEEGEGEPPWPLGEAAALLEGLEPGVREGVGVGLGDWLGQR